MENMIRDIENIRKEYQKGTLEEKDLPKNPDELFEKWLNEAIRAEIIEPTAMVLCTSSRENKPSARMVLLKEFQNNTYTFYTNYSSRKGRELNENPFAFLLFYWGQLERQIRIEGIVRKASREKSERYFNTRPLESRISAIISKQSEKLSDRKILEDEFEKMLASGITSTVPEFWGGFELIAQKYEFWQGRPSRLHDRIVYELQENNNWIMYRLYP